MANLNIRREHKLNEVDCRNLATDLLGQLVNKYGGSICDQGHCLDYRHSSGMKASIAPKEGELDINIKLNMLTRSFAPEIEKRLNEVLDEHLS